MLEVLLREISLSFFMVSFNMKLTLLLAGETCYRENDNLVDAIVMGTKRIGHGF